VEDFRYTVVDNRAALIGIPGSAGEKETTKKGYRISSEGLAAILREHFFYCYEESKTYEDYLKYTIEHTGSSLRMLSRELKVDEAELQRISGR
jgi:predicted DNA-binding ArsR family transcriptional regulator